MLNPSVLERPINELFSNVESFSRGKNEDRDEDYFGRNKDTLVLSDGATDHSGKLYEFEGKSVSGGEIASIVTVRACLESVLNGSELVEEVNRRLRVLYAPE